VPDDCTRVTQNALRFGEQLRESTADSSNLLARSASFLYSQKFYKSHLAGKSIDSSKDYYIQGTNKTGNARTKIPLRRVRVTTVAVEKQKVLHILSVCVCVSVVLVTQHAKRMRRMILTSVACLVLSYFFTLSHKRHDFRS